MKKKSENQKNISKLSKKMSDKQWLFLKYRLQDASVESYIATVKNIR